MPQLSVITCLRSRAVSRNWDYHIWLLQRTLDSILVQERTDLKVIVSCHEIPQIPQASHPQVHFLPVEFAPPERNNDEMCADKVLKLTAGVDWALKQGTDYVMFADGDDLVSNRFAAFVAQNRGANGWFSNSEFLHRYGGMILRRHDMAPGRSGPTIVVRAEALSFADASDSSEFWHHKVSSGGNERYLQALCARGPRVNTLAAIGHTNYLALLDSIGYSIQPLPFVASMVILHADSTSNVPGGEGSRVDGMAPRHPLWRRRLSRFKQVVRALPTLRLLTPQLCHEFSVPTGETVPCDFRSRALPC